MFDAVRIDDKPRLFHLKHHGQFSVGGPGMVYGVQAAGDGCLCVLGAVYNSKAGKQRED